MAYLLSSDHKRFICTETVIGTVLGSVLPVLVMWFTFGPFPMAVWGSEGFAVFTAKNAFGMATVMTLIMTVVVRMRIAKGAVPSLHWDRASQPALRLVATHIILRAPLFGIACGALFGSVSVLVILVLGLDTIDRMSFAIFIGVQSAVIAITLIPVILIGAMTDRIAASGIGALR